MNRSSSRSAMNRSSSRVAELPESPNCCEKQSSLSAYHCGCSDRKAMWHLGTAGRDGIRLQGHRLRPVGSLPG